MKILFSGLGSIGLKHLMNVTAELSDRNIPCEIYALRSSNRHLGGYEALLSGSYYAYSEVPDDFDIIFVTNPTHMHLDTVQKLSSKTKSFFIEKPLFMNPDDLGRADFSNKISFVACPLRQSPVLKRVREIVEKKKRIPHVNAVCSSYLPSWRQTDYRESYSARKNEGGGVRRDLVHEWDYLTWIFGKPQMLSSYFGRYSSLEITSEDTAVYIAKYDGMLLSLSLDYVGREPHRSLTMVCDDETIYADIINNIIFHRWGGLTTEDRFEPVDIHRAEISHFLDIFEGKTENDNPPETAASILKYSLGEL